jgi:predicted small secreted protein
MSFRMLNGGMIMVQKLVTVALVGTALVLAACNTVRGAGQDVQSAANCTENAVHGGKC